ncbi:hypothetical protein N7G274_009509 [Stereocaulon virgatum]|uniref:Uncharacterized protein n=1 Tax=Stereocaulon virgatum TaxID=373712 RepID=A0ABR3ZW01_9LECA
MVDKGKIRGRRGIMNWVSGILASCPVADWLVIHFVNEWPSISKSSINSALKTLVDSGYVDKTYKAMNIGAVDNVKAMALELSFDATGATMDFTKLIIRSTTFLPFSLKKRLRRTGI